MACWNLFAIDSVGRRCIVLEINEMGADLVTEKIKVNPALGSPVRLLQPKMSQRDGGLPRDRSDCKGEMKGCVLHADLREH